MSFLANLIRLLCAPVFFALAWLNYVLGAMAPSPPSMAAMPGMAMPPAGATLYGVHLSPEVVTAIGSWWLMYVLMGVCCLPVWLALFQGKPRAKSTSRPAPVRHFSD